MSLRVCGCVGLPQTIAAMPDIHSLAVSLCKYSLKKFYHACGEVVPRLLDPPPNASTVSPLPSPTGLFNISAHPFYNHTIK